MRIDFRTLIRQRCIAVDASHSVSRRTLLCSAHNAEPFAHCYQRLAEIIPQLIGEGCNPRIMLDYSGNLLWGVEQMGRRDILEALQRLSGDPSLQPHVEWLGSFWSITEKKS